VSGPQGRRPSPRSRNTRARPRRFCVREQRQQGRTPRAREGEERPPRCRRLSREPRGREQGPSRPPQLRPAGGVRGPLGRTADQAARLPEQGSSRRAVDVPEGFEAAWWRRTEEAVAGEQFDQLVGGRLPRDSRRWPRARKDLGGVAARVGRISRIRTREDDGVEDQRSPSRQGRRSGGLRPSLIREQADQAAKRTEARAPRPRRSPSGRAAWPRSGRFATAIRAEGVLGPQTRQVEIAEEGRSTPSEPGDDDHSPVFGPPPRSRESPSPPLRSPGIVREEAHLGPLHGRAIETDAEAGSAKQGDCDRRGPAADPGWPRFASHGRRPGNWAARSARRTGARRLEDALSPVGFRVILVAPETPGAPRRAPGREPHDGRVEEGQLPTARVAGISSTSPKARRAGTAIPASPPLRNPDRHGARRPPRKIPRNGPGEIESRRNPIRAPLRPATIQGQGRKSSPITARPRRRTGRDGSRRWQRPREVVLRREGR